MKEDFLWVEKYRPKKVKDTVLPNHLKKAFQTFVDDKNVPNLLLTGGPGVGKTTVAKAMLDEMDSDYIIINGSMNGNIDTLRVEIANFASTVSFGEGRKYVILDEADYLNANSTQPALRNFMEEFSSNCGFILTCNFKNRIIQPLHSRCSVIDFNIPSKEKSKIATQFFKRVCSILDTEDITYDKKVVAELVTNYFPDWRRCINELQHFSSIGPIDSSVLVNHSSESFDELYAFMKKKDFTNVRKWVANNNDVDSSVLYRTIEQDLPKLMNSASSIAESTITIADYEYRESFVANPEISRAACLAVIMSLGDWK